MVKIEKCLGLKCHNNKDSPRFLRLKLKQNHTPIEKNAFANAVRQLPEVVTAETKGSKNTPSKVYIF
jgi:hypothetical protein